MAGWGRKSGGWKSSSWSADLLNPAVTEALAPIKDQEQEWQDGKLEKRIRGYFRSGAKGMEFDSKPWNLLVEEYADNVWSAIFQALHEREWVTQIDLLMAMDAGIKETFPPHVISGVPPAMFEATVLAANDRAFEDQRFLPALWELVQPAVDGPKTKKKVYEAFDLGRKRAMKAMEALKIAGGAAAGPLDTFTEAWITATVMRLFAVSNEEKQALIPLETCSALFSAAIAQGGLPLSLTNTHGQPPNPYPLIDETLAKTFEGCAAGTLVDNTPVESSKAKARANYGQGASGWGSQGAGAKRSWGASQGWDDGSAAWGAWGGFGPFGGFGGGFGGYGGYGGYGAKGWGKGKGAGGSSWSGKGGDAAAKKPKTVPATVPAAGKKGHPKCTQAEDCIGNATTPLVQHVDNGKPGDVYCKTCWGVFAASDATLKAAPYAS